MLTARTLSCLYVDKLPSGHAAVLRSGLSADTFPLGATQGVRFGALCLLAWGRSFACVCMLSWCHACTLPFGHQKDNRGTTRAQEEEKPKDKLVATSGQEADNGTARRRQAEGKAREKRTTGGQHRQLETAASFFFPKRRTQLLSCCSPLGVLPSCCPVVVLVLSGRSLSFFCVLLVCSLFSFPHPLSSVVLLMFSFHISVVLLLWCCLRLRCFPRQGLGLGPPTTTTTILAD